MGVAAAAVTLLDRTTFVRWARREHRLPAAPGAVLEFVVTELLGMGGARPCNGWTTAPVLANATGLNERTVRRSLARLEALGLIRRWGVRGRGGRLLLHVAGIEGAAERLKRPRLGTAAPPSKTGPRDPVSAVENRADRASKTGPRDPVNPTEEPSLKGRKPPEGAPGCAGSPACAAAARVALDDDQDQEALLSLPLVRVLRRLEGLAKKVDRRFIVNAALFALIDEARKQRWLRLQREGRDSDLLRDAFAPLALHLGFVGFSDGRRELAKVMGRRRRREPDDQEEARGNAVPIRRPDPKPAAAARPEPAACREVPARPEDPPPPARRPARPVAVLATALRSGTAAPPASPPERPPLELDPAELRASASRLVALDPPAPRPGRRASFHNHRDPVELAASVARLNASVASARL